MRKDEWLPRVKEGSRAGREVSVAVKGHHTTETLALTERFYVLTVSMSASWFCYWTVVLEGVTIEGKWVKDIQNPFVLFLTCKSIIMSKVFKIKGLR